MLTVKNLSKVYTPKNGVTVRAIDNITLTFPEKGMVFLLGKSGSGKSTLLNICGGLDSPTSGEIIVKGRSCKNFSQDDFDSYRNTYVGFIFQEYNILNEFTVEDNIALALELQNKPRNKSVIKKLLSDVDLSGFAKRKPNTLSGGEKQRIAIARALIKNPEIIMADEPTGALDSATGKQVFEVLKKLSQDKLVIVVSHDREFAKQYGDRIIELKDGKVISDISKTQENYVSLTDNIEAMGNIFYIKPDASLNEEDFEKIKMLLNSTNEGAIIATGEKEIEDFKKASRITEDGGRNIFRQTEEPEAVTERSENCEFISSRLPLRHAAKIGLSGLKSKPIRLFFTLMLCIAAFTLFGILSTMLLYNGKTIFKKTIMDSDQSVVRLNKEYSENIDWYSGGKLKDSYKQNYKTTFTQKEIENLKENYGKDLFAGVDTLYSFDVNSKRSAYWLNKINTMAYMDADNALYKTIQGRYPKNDNEICISSYTANVLYNCSTYNEERKLVNFTSPKNTIGKRIILSGKPYIITGIFDCGTLPEKFDMLKTKTQYTDEVTLLDALNSTLNDGLYLVAFTTESNVKQLSIQNSQKNDEIKQYKSIVTAVNIDGRAELPKFANAVYKGFSKKAEEIKINYINSDTVKPNGNQVIINKKLFCDIITKVYLNKQRKTEDSNLIEEYSNITMLCYDMVTGGSQIYDPDLKYSVFTPFDEEAKAENLKAITDALKRDKVDLTLTAQLYDIASYDELDYETTLEVIGFWEGEAISKNDTTIYVSNSLEKTLWETQKSKLDSYEDRSTKYICHANAFYSEIFLPYNHTANETENYSKFYMNTEYAENDSHMKLTGMFVENLEMVDYNVKRISKIFLVVGIAVAIFAALLLSNFISASIVSKRKDIGILRAVGAKSADIFKIFFAESGFIAFVCIFISTIASAVICSIINNNLAENLGAKLFAFGVTPFILLVLISLLTTFLATFFPVRKAAIKKPIESITSV